MEWVVAIVTTGFPCGNGISKTVEIIIKQSPAAVRPEKPGEAG